jgi:triacylglycerol lipase
MKHPILFSFLFTLCTCVLTTAYSQTNDTVVLLHGLNRTHHAMAKLADALQADGYTVINCDYPSRSADISTLSSNVFVSLLPQLPSSNRVHFVTHSMGGILLRTYLDTHSITNLGRVVMLAPPNQGSEVVDTLRGLPPFGWINGPAGLQLGTETNSVPNRLKPPQFDLGIIAGDRSMNPLFSYFVPGKDDGKVSVTNAQITGMSDFIVMHVTHTFMMRNSGVIAQIKYFLKKGCFERTLQDHPPQRPRYPSHLTPEHTPPSPL